MAEDVTELVPKMNYIESLSSRIAHRLNQDRNGDHIDYLKMKLGLETILINLSKCSIVYGISFILGLFVETLILHAAYAVLRNSSYGLHANTSWVCTLLSIGLFIGFPYLSSYIPFGILPTISVGAIIILLLFLYAPADTDKTPIIGAKRREALRNRAIISALIITIIALLLPYPSIRSLLMLGMTIQIVMILPLTYKLFRRSVNNYEQYETGS